MQAERSALHTPPLHQPVGRVGKEEIVIALNGPIPQ